MEQAVLTKWFIGLPLPFKSEDVCPRCKKLGLFLERIQGVNDIDVVCLFCGARWSKVEFERQGV